MGARGSENTLWSEYLRARRILIVLGAGGVGKTTMSLALGTIAAIHGRNVAVLSIDPARRLAAALGISMGAALNPVQFPSSLGISGSLDAVMVDQKAVFDDMVRRFAPSAGVASKILANSLYQAASANLGGAIEYMALAKLEQIIASSRYDLIVLDTPPDSHALDFLARPNILASFIDNKVISWLLRPLSIAGKLGLMGVLSVSERLFSGMAKVTGMAALHKLAEFFVLMQEVIEGFHGAGLRVKEVLSAPGTSYVLVTVPEYLPARAAQAIRSELGTGGHDIDLMIANRCVPGQIMEQLASLDERLIKDEQELELFRVLRSRLNTQALEIAKLKKSLASLGSTPQFVELPEYDGLVLSAESMYHFAKHLNVHL